MTTYTHTQRDNTMKVQPEPTGTGTCVPMHQPKQGGMS